MVQGSKIQAERDFVLSFLKTRGVAAQDAEDLAQEVLGVFLRRRTHFDDLRPLRPWLRGIALHVARDFFRRARRQPLLESTHDDGWIERESAHGPSEAAEARWMLEHLMKQVPVPHRQVYLLHELWGFPIPKIAQDLGIPVNTAYSRLRLARRSVRCAATASEAHGPQA